MDVEQRYFADVCINVRVYFTDNGTDSLSDQAYDEVRDAFPYFDQDGVLEDNGIEIIGTPQLTTPATVEGVK